MEGSDPHMEGSGISNPYGFEGPKAVWSVWVLQINLSQLAKNVQALESTGGNSWSFVESEILDGWSIWVYSSNRETSPRRSDPLGSVKGFLDQSTKLGQTGLPIQLA